MRVLVTGAAGFIGSHVTDLLHEGHPVVAVDCSPTTTTGREARQPQRLPDAPRVRVPRGRPRLRRVAPRVADVDVVFHLAGQPGVRPSWGRLPELRRAQRRRHPAAAGGGPGRPTRRASSTPRAPRSTATPTATRAEPTRLPFSPYGVTKLAAEHLCAYAPQLGSRPSPCATSPSTGPGSAPTWPSTASSARARRGAGPGLRHRRADPRLHLRRRRRRSDHPRRHAAGEPGSVLTSAAARRSPSTSPRPARRAARAAGRGRALGNGGKPETSAGRAGRPSSPSGCSAGPRPSTSAPGSPGRSPGTAPARTSARPPSWRTCGRPSTRRRRTTPRPACSSGDDRHCGPAIGRAQPSAASRWCTANSPTAVASGSCSCSCANATGPGSSRTLFVSGELGVWAAPIRDLGIDVTLLTGSPRRQVARLPAGVPTARPVRLRVVGCLHQRLRLVARRTRRASRRLVP